MGNPPPPYAMQPSVSGKSPKGSQSPRPSPKPSPLHHSGQPVPSPHGTVGSVGSPHHVQSPHPGSRADTPQMSPHGSVTSQPTTPQAGSMHLQFPGQPTMHPGMQQNMPGPTSMPHGMLPGQGQMRMTSSSAGQSVPSTQATMAQLASMTQGFPGQHPHPQGVMLRPGSRPQYLQQHSGSLPPGHMMPQVMGGGQPPRVMSRMMSHQQVNIASKLTQPNHHII